MLCFCYKSCITNLFVSHKPTRVYLGITIQYKLFYHFKLNMKEFENYVVFVLSQKLKSQKIN